MKYVQSFQNNYMSARLFSTNAPMPPLENFDGIPAFIVNAFVSPPSLTMLNPTCDYESDENAADLSSFLIAGRNPNNYLGNPAGVCIMTEFLSDSKMQHIASSLAYSETAFVKPLLQGSTEPGNFSPLRCDLRWFTPTNEIDLCGHATMASAQALVHLKQLDEGGIVEFNTRSGILTVANGPNGNLSMDFPQTPVNELWSESEKQKVTDALCIDRTQVLFVGKNTVNEFDYLVQLNGDESMLEKVTPDFSCLNELSGRGVIVTCSLSPHEHVSFDFAARCFYPKIGINEDPCTGSAQCTLAPFWANILGKNELSGIQLSKRGGLVNLVDGESVNIKGFARVSVEGRLLED